jgi:acrylyl-CoA reductase (NADPH)
MIIGTAGFTAMLCVMALEDAGIRPKTVKLSSPAPAAAWAARPRCCISWAIRLLRFLAAKAPMTICELGASRILGRDEFAETRPLEKQLWAGAVDTVGDKVLAKVLAQMNYGGCVAACGLAGGLPCQRP